MKRNLHIAFLVATVFLFGSTTNAQTDSVVMGFGYPEDVFYSFKNGEVSKAARANWDIAFYTARFSAGIITNDGSGVELYTYPNGDTTVWATTLDTNGMSNWTKMYNTVEYWEEGAFNINGFGQLDYGWGVYNMVDHSLYGDSLYIIQTLDGIKKLWIEKKVSIDNIYMFKYADLDGANEQVVELDVKPFETKMFAYYSLVTNEALDREPLNENWDILFTKYMGWTTTNEGDSVRYIKTGVTSNVDVYAKNFYPVGPAFSDWFPGPFDSTKAAIGSDWKYFDMSTFQYVVKDSNYYFVKTFDGDVYKLGFGSWDYTTGTCVFEKSVASLASIGDNLVEEETFAIFPNPATDHISLKTPNLQSGMFTVHVLDQVGHQIFTADYSDWDLNQGIKLANLKMASGIYIVSITGDNYAKSQKLVVR